MARPQPWQARQARDVRVALEIVRGWERAACFDLVRAVVEQTVADLRFARGADLDTAVLYLLQDDGELVRWHADVLGLDLAALRARARALLAERLGDEAAAALWERMALLAGGRRRAA